MKIGLFFGSFNPIHIGHLIIAQFFTQETDLEKVLLVPSPQNPLKKTSELLSESDRLKMVELCIEDHPNLLIEDIEFTLPKPSYTFKTLEQLRKKYMQDELVLIIGSDSLENFHLWKNYEDILKSHKVYVYPRTKEIKHRIIAQELKPQIKIFKAPIIEVSSTKIRENKKKGILNNYLVFYKALDYFNNL
jgi:nicotinate-nucleotide adenylyltransferase